MSRSKSTFAILPTVITTYCILLFITLPFLFISPTGYSQFNSNPLKSPAKGEFGKSTNGLIYSDYTINQLKYIVDSLNLKFKICDLNPTYQSKLQARGHYVFLEKGNIKKAITDIENNLSFKDFVQKYGPSEIEKDLLFVKFTYENYDGKPEVNFSSIEVGDAGEYELRFSENRMRFEKPLKGKWVFKHWTTEESVKEGLMAFYFTEDFKQQTLPTEYARMVQYSDCLVDTTAQIFYEDAIKNKWKSNTSEPATITRFLHYIHKKTNKPELKGDEYESYHKAYTIWDSTRFITISKALANTSLFKNLLADAVTDALKTGGSEDEFEEYVSLYYSPKTALELKRRRVVIGQCSQDLRPRAHAFNIAQLSAETINWEIFLRAHLDIMNDNFERASDGSYAWERRKTYIRELEVLDINVSDLLLGISLRIENPGKNHYYGSISRLGRALAESHQTFKIESQLLSMIADPELDDYNRILMYYLYLNYNYHLEDKDKKKENIIRLNQAVKMMPAYLSFRAKVKE